MIKQDRVGLRKPRRNSITTTGDFGANFFLFFFFGYTRIARNARFIGANQTFGGSRRSNTVVKPSKTTSIAPGNARTYIILS